MQAMSVHPITHYAPARRSGKDVIERQRQLVAGYCGSLQQLYNTVSELILVVNQERQIVFFNAHVPAWLDIGDPERIYGLRPGELLDCRHACLNAGGCGTSEFCSQCGAVNAILASLSNKADLRECSLLQKDTNQAFDLLVRTTPLPIEGQIFSIVAITDMSHEKRRRILERIFFHDIMNTAVGVNLLAQALDTESSGPEAESRRRNLVLSARQLIDELRSQKELLAAENGELEPQMRLLDGCLLTKEIVEVFSNRYREHRIVLAALNGHAMLKTDQGLLGRVIGNMIQNAVEASRPDQTITVSAGVAEDYAEFRVHNPGFMPRDVQLQLFHRSFSTKGPGRGLGTYSMKLLSERYLNGSVGCRSSEQDGTVFVARYRDTVSEAGDGGALGWRPGA